MELFFREFGQGYPIIILHGLFGSSDNWLTLGKKFAEYNKVYLVDLRNHGSSFHDEEFNYKVMAEDILQLYKNQKIDDAIVLGHSMGGKVAMTFAQQNLEKVSKLIVADISPAAYPLRHDVIVETLAAVKIEDISTRQEADLQLQQFIPEVEIRQFLLKNLTRNKDGNFKWKLNLPIIERDIDNVGEPVSTGQVFPKPTLFIKGGRSKYILDKDLPLMNKIFPNHQLITMPGAGHWLHAEQPEAFYSIVKDFIAKIE
ncbi:MAG: alpha/beta fold hydrolase [Bacteroidota bacterium]|nr:alpha/beta fold hydrolase [Bacteroidota bacterium]